LTEGDVAVARTFLNESPNEFLRARVEAFRLLKHHQDRLPTTLAAPETWEALRLPLPAPLPLPTIRMTPGSDRASAVEVPLHFREVEIQGVRCYASMKLEDLHVEPDRGQWIFVIGENGAGKTTLLRALAMALVGREVGDLALGSSETVYRRQGTQRATIDVRRTTGSVVFQASIRGENGREVFEAQTWPEMERPFVVGYGCRRGSALGGRQRALDLSRLAAIQTLFDDPTTGLVHAEQWLMNLHHAAALEKTPNGAKELLDSVLDLLKQLLPDIDRPVIDEHGVWVNGPATGGIRVRLGAMSDGYLTSLGWVLDMMARWIKQKQDAGKKIPRDFHEAMTGVVLLDELDLHLHPRWQLRAVGDLKKLFRRMTFVVTTHNPMTLVGAHKREIWVLHREPERGMVALRPDTDPRLRTGSELYARFFGLTKLYPDNLGEKLRRYGFLASSPYRNDEEEREVHTLFAELRQEGINPGFPPEPREGT
ncbi:MAG: AAA family ATPase, partial [Polyangiaceae bacterium]